MLCNHIIFLMEAEPVKKALQIVGTKGKYQYLLILAFSLLFYVQVFPILGTSLYYMDPIFRCEGDNQLLDERVACPKLYSCHVQNDFTIVSELGLYCDNQGTRDMIQSMVSFGSMVGLILMNFLSDIKGRKQALQISTIISILGVLSTIIGGSLSVIPFLIIGSLLSGFGGYSTFTICYIMAGQFCSDRLRQKSALIMNFAYSFGLVSLYFFYNYMNEWKKILVCFVLIPLCILYALIKFYFQESPFYYYTIGRKDECIQALRKIGVCNKKIETIFTIQILIKSENAKKQPVKLSNKIYLFCEIFTNTKYISIILLTALTEAGGNLFYFGIEFAINDIGYDYGIDNVILGGTEMVMTLVLTGFVAQLPRKKTIIISYFFVSIISFLFLIPYVGKSAMMASIIIVIIRSLTTLAYFMIVMIQTESFPSQIQSVGAGSIQSLSQLGSILAPIIITSSVNAGLNKMSMMGLITLLLTFCIGFIPEPRRSDNSELNEQVIEGSNDTL